MDSSFEIGSIAILLLLNGLFTVAESAIILARRSQIEDLGKERQSVSAQRLLFFKDNPERFFASVQVSVVVLIALISALSLHVVYTELPPLLRSVPEIGHRLRVFVSILVSATASSFLVLTFGILVPRAIGNTVGERFSMAAALFVLWASVLLKPVEKLSVWTSLFVLWITRKAKNARISFAADEGRKILLKEGRDCGLFDSPENELIHSVWEFSDIEVREVMVPKPKIVSLRINTPPETVLKYVVENGFSRYPVYRETLDDTVGILYNKDLLSLLERKKEFTLREVTRPVHFVTENMKVRDVLKDMQRRRQNMFMVVSEYGSVVGLVTVEDAIEEIVGEVRDENESVVQRVVEQPDGALFIDASVTIRELSSDYGLPLEESDEYDTLAGFMISKIATIPKGGESVQANGYRYTIMNMDRRRISHIKAEKSVSTKRPAEEVD